MFSANPSISPFELKPLDVENGVGLGGERGRTSGEQGWTDGERGRTGRERGRTRGNGVRLAGNRAGLAGNGVGLEGLDWRGRNGGVARLRWGR